MTSPTTGRAAAPVSQVLVIGSGLIGASVGLGLRRLGVDVVLEDSDPESLRVAASRGAGRAGRPEGDPDLVIVAVPPASAAAVISAALRMYVTSTVSDVVSVKARLQLEVERTGVDLSRFVPGHPLAGREVSGAAAATADLFADRVWALCPSQFTDPDRLELVRAVVTALGAVAVVTTPESHDVAVALTSHTPQVVSSLVAAGLDPLEEADVRLSGQGLRDVTRLASSDPDLWTEILTSNAGPVAASLDGLIWRLGQVRDGLRQGGSGAAAVREALVAGNAGASNVAINTASLFLLGANLLTNTASVNVASGATLNLGGLRGRARGHRRPARRARSAGDGGRRHRSQPRGCAHRPRRRASYGAGRVVRASCLCPDLEGRIAPRGLGGPRLARADVATSV